MKKTSKTNNMLKITSFVLAMLTLVACSSPDDLQMVQTARDYLGNRKMQEASLELKNALQQNPENAEARYLLGQINLELGDFGAAEKEFRRARKAGWQEEEAQIGLARTLIYGSKFQDLINEVEIKEDYSPTARANLYGLLAAAEAGLGKVEQARETLATGAAIEANAIHLLKITIQIQLATGELKAAAITLGQALSAHPSDPEILLLSATMAIQDQDYAVAREACQKVIAQTPVKLMTVYGRQARLGLIRLGIMDKNLDQAQFALEYLLKMSADDPEANYLGGMLAFEQGNNDLAEGRLLKVLRITPEHSPTQLLFGTVRYAQQDYEQAVHYISRYVSAVPENLGARKLLGRAYMMLGQHDEAQAILQSAITEQTEDAELLALMGLSLLQEGNTASGIEGLEHALKVAPESVVMREQLAKAYISTGDTDRAVQELKIILAESGEKEHAEALLVIAHLRAGNFDQAINTVLEMLARSPDDPAVLTLAGNVFVASDDKPEARKYFTKALQIRPGFVPATLTLAGLKEQEGKYAEAAALYKGIIDTDPEFVAPLLALARLAETQGKTDEKLDWLEQARERAPEDINSRMVLADYYLRERQLKKAELLINEAIKIGPRQVSLLTLQCRVLMAAQRYNEALPLLNDLIKMAPDSVFARALLGETYLKLRQKKDSRAQLEIILEKQPSYVPALALMVGVELQSSHYEQALEYAEQIQKAQPDLAMGYELAGETRSARKEYAEAKTAYTQAWDLRPSATLAIKLSEASMRSEKPDEATSILLAWLNDHPDDARVLQSLGMRYQDMGQNDKAIDKYLRVLVVQPGNVVALNNLAWLYSLADNPKALVMAERAYRETPRNPGIQDTYGWILVQNGQVDKGRGLLKQALEMLSEVPEVRYHYAVALLKSGEQVEAKKRLNQLLQSEPSFEGREDAQVLLEKQ